MKYIMHVLGPDEEIKFDSEEDALKEANAINASHVIALAGMTEEKKKFYPQVMAYVLREDKYDELTSLYWETKVEEFIESER